MLLTSERERPCRPRLSRWSSGRFTVTVLSSTVTVMGSGSTCDSSPLGPLTVTDWPSTLISTPDGTLIGALPIRDMLAPLPDVGEDFPAHLVVVRLTVGEQSLGGRDDRDTQPAEDLGQFGGLGVHAQAGLRDALDALDAPLA